MGSGNSKNGYTFAEASKLLGRSERTVHKYVKSGVLRSRREKGRVFLFAEDVEQLQKDLEIDRLPLNRQSFLQLLARVQRLEMDMTVLRRMHDIQGDPLRVPGEVAVDLYRSAELELKNGKWFPDTIKNWSLLFDRVDEVFLTQLSKSLDQPAPWDVFYKLCLGMMDAVSSAPEFRTSLELQELHKQLDQGRRVIRGTIITWAEMGKGCLSPVILDVLGDHGSSVERRLAANEASS